MKPIKKYLKLRIKTLYRFLQNLKWILAKKDLPEISIIIPYYNDNLDFVNSCLKSIKFQFYKNIEILIIDDFSKVESVNKLKKIIPSNARVISHLKNKGLSAARNTGLKNAQGDYILFLDADDMIHAFALYNLARGLITRPENSKLIIGSYGRNTALYPYQSAFIKFLIGFQYILNRGTLSFVNVAGYLPFNIHACLLDRKMLIDNNFHFNENMLDGAEDWEFWYHLMRGGYTFSDSKSYAGIYRQREKSMSRSKALLHFNESYQLIEKSFTQDTSSKVFQEPWFKYTELNLKVSRCIRELTVSFLQENLGNINLWNYIDRKHSSYIENYLDIDKYVQEGISKFHCSKKVSDLKDIQLIQKIRDNIF